MRKFAGKIQTKEIPFMGDKLEIRKLTTAGIRRIGKASEAGEGSDEDSLKILLAIFTEGVVLEEGEKALDLPLLEEFPLDELNKLASSIMEYAGVIAEGNDG